MATKAWAKPSVETGVAWSLGGCGDFEVVAQDADQPGGSALYLITCIFSSVTKPSVTISSMCGSSSAQREDHATPLCMAGPGGWAAMMRASASSISFQQGATSTTGRRSYTCSRPGHFGRSVSSGGR
ncbi:MAG: hypothetical protein IH895_06975 [Planctomycetes bacterium]|nr:hypothetical protein [Planctomycetota bacterium]